MCAFKLLQVLVVTSATSANVPQGQSGGAKDLYVAYEKCVAEQNKRCYSNYLQEFANLPDFVSGSDQGVHHVDGRATTATTTTTTTTTHAYKVEDSEAQREQLEIDRIPYSLSYEQGQRFINFNVPAEWWKNKKAQFVVSKVEGALKRVVDPTSIGSALHQKMLGRGRAVLTSNDEVDSVSGALKNKFGEAVRKKYANEKRLVDARKGETHDRSQ
jgi:hypothetical protein